MLERLADEYRREGTVRSFSLSRFLHCITRVVCFSGTV